MYRQSPSKIWRKRKNKYLLNGSKSLKTKKVYYPPVNVEPGSLNTKFELSQMPQKAKLVTWSIVHVGPQGFDHMTPYAVAILEFDNGERLTAQIVDTDINKLEIGDVFYPTFRKISELDDAV